MRRDMQRIGRRVSSLLLRKRIYSIIESSPGLHFRELKRRTGLGSGNLEYHLRYLEGIGIVKSDKANGKKRYYPAKIGEKDREMLGILRQRNFRRIVLHLLEKERATNKDVAELLEVRPSTATWYLKQLLEKGIVRKEEKSKRVFYCLTQKTGATRLLITYRESFIDKIVDRFVESWEK